MNDTLYLLLKKRLNEVYSIEPNDLRHPMLTNMYKRLTHRLKTYPFIVIIPASLLLSLLVYGVIGLLIVRVVSILQFGF